MCRPRLSRHARIEEMSKGRTTRWSLVLAAAGRRATGDDGAQPDERSPDERSRTALAELCRIYWPAVYAFARRSGHAPHDALDLTQSFFVRVLERNWLASADPRRGTFRGWLFVTFKHFAYNEWRRARAHKRGGTAVVFSIDAADAEGRYAHEPVELVSPEDLYHRRWAISVLAHVAEQLEHELASSEHPERFARLQRFLVGDEPSYQELARELGAPVGTLRVQVHRLRRRYRALLRETIAETVADPADVEDELRALFTALSTPEVSGWSSHGHESR
jgi:RNA polymerase sigma-70 factor (ECF subfamily)